MIVKLFPNQLDSDTMDMIVDYDQLTNDLYNLYEKSVFHHSSHNLIFEFFEFLRSSDNKAHMVHVIVQSDPLKSHVFYKHQVPLLE